ncbi:MAG: hypothetical protein EAZ61_09435 [Oscillatoriales cyanobacterium]|nr:MAG: hypothetical protein EAZ61_09435 [Oscillatoriales cyanobacterium]
MKLATELKSRSRLEQRGFKFTNRVSEKPSQAEDWKWFLFTFTIQRSRLMKLTEINLRTCTKKTVDIAVEPKIGKGLRRMLSQKLSLS